MHSEFTKRIFTSIILLIGIFSFLKYANEDFFLGFILIIGFICYFEWLLVNSDTLGDRNFYKNSSIYLFGFFYFLLVLPTSAFYLRFDINLNFFYLILIVCIFSDVGGYVVGKTIGGKKLTKISPNKTISGSIGSFIFSMLSIFFMMKWISNYSFTPFVIYRVLLGSVLLLAIYFFF